MDLLKPPTFFTKYRDDLLGEPCCPPEMFKRTKLMFKQKYDLLGCCGKEINSSLQPPSNAYSPPPAVPCSVLRTRTDAGVINNGDIFAQTAQEGFDLDEDQFEVYNTGTEPITGITVGTTNGIVLNLGIAIPFNLSPGGSTGPINFTLLTAALPPGDYSTQVTFTGQTASCGSVSTTFRLNITQTCAIAYPEDVEINGTPTLPATPPNEYLYAPLPIVGVTGGIDNFNIKFINPSPTYNGSVLSSNPTFINNISFPAGITYAPTLPLPNQTGVVPGGIFPTLGGTFTVAAGTPIGTYEADLIVPFFICSSIVELTVRVQIQVI